MKLLKAIWSDLPGDFKELVRDIFIVVIAGAFLITAAYGAQNLFGWLADFIFE